MLNSQTLQHLLDWLLHQIAWHRWRTFLVWLVLSISLLVTVSQTSDNFINWQVVIHPVTMVSLLLGASLILPIWRQHLVLTGLAHVVILGGLATLIVQYNTPSVEQLNTLLDVLWVLPFAAAMTTVLGLRIRQVRDFYQQKLTISYNQFVDWLGSMLAVPILATLNCFWIAIVPEASLNTNLVVGTIGLAIFALIVGFFDTMMDRLVLIYRPQT